MLQGLQLTMKYIGKMTLRTVWLATILLASTTMGAVLPKESVTTPEVRLQEKTENARSSFVDQYKNMVQFEQEEGLSDDIDEDRDEKDNSGSLMSMMTSDGDYDAAEASDDQSLLSCVSCTGVLPTWHDKKSAYIDEQSYCLPDSSSSTIQQNGDNEKNDVKHQSICTGAVRCWKVKVREREGFVRISRGCVGGGNKNHFIHLCMGAVPVVSSQDNVTAAKSGDKPTYTVWTSSVSQKQQQFGSPPPSYAVECCTGRDHCNDGPFPLLPGDSLVLDNDGSLFTTFAGWRWSIVFALVLLIVIGATVTTVIFLKTSEHKKRRKRRRRRSKSGSRQKSKKQKQNIHGRCEDEGGNSDDSDKKPHRRFSFTSDSSMSSSSISSMGSSSCCEGKPSRKRGKRKPHATALNILDLLKDVVVTNEATDEGDSHRLSYTVGYSAAAITESTVDDDFLPPPYKQKDHEDNDWTSGSGYGMPVLVQRTLAKQIQLRQLVGKGRYGEVWRATYWNGGHEHVAVKIFLSKDEPSWKRETEIYSTVLMRHDNILGFIGSDIMTSRNSYTTQLLLITHYHQHGSLYDFLQTSTGIDALYNSYNVPTSDANAGGRLQQNEKDRPPLTIAQMLNVLYTVAAGLCHLHTEIHGTQGKPGIAHRDIKSKNVLVKCARTGACCVADFGMAVTSRDATLPAQTTTTAGAGNNQNTRVGTKRYMAPEVLDDSISSAAALALASASTAAVSSSSAASSSSAYWCFDAYRRGDVYSYALVVWEVLSRTLISSESDDINVPQKPLNDKNNPSVIDNSYNPLVYRAPYQDRGVGWDPGFDDMRRIVCSSDPVLSRPGVATEWLSNPIVNTVVVTMRECWHGNPNARLPTLRVKKTLAKLLSHNLKMDHQSGSTTTTDQL